MIKSMTGYGSAKGQAGDLQISVEVKSVNNRYLDASVRMPRSFLFAEDALKSAIQRHVSRGKVDMFVTVDSSAADNMSVKVNEPLLRGYLAAIRHISDTYGLQNDLTAVSAGRFPIRRVPWCPTATTPLSSPKSCPTRAGSIAAGRSSAVTTPMRTASKPSRAIRAT